MKFPISLGGKTFYIDMTVVQGPLGFNLLLGHDYVYFMGALVSSLFHVDCFPHKGRIVTIDQLSFIGPQMPPLQPYSPIGYCFQVVPSPPQVNYVGTCSIPMSTDDLVGDVVNHLLGALEYDLSIGSFGISLP